MCRCWWRLLEPWCCSSRVREWSPRRPRRRRHRRRRNSLATPGRRRVRSPAVKSCQADGVERILVAIPATPVHVTTEMYVPFHRNKKDSFIFFPAFSLCLCECVCCVGQLQYALADELTPSCLYAYDATSSYACTCVCLCVYEIPIPIARVHQDSMSRPGTRRHVHLPTHVRSSMRTQWKNLWQ